MSAASDNLRNHQEQADIDGCMVMVSRQAVDDTLAEYGDMLTALKVAREYIVKVDGTMAFTPPENRVTAPDLALVNAAIAKALGANHSVRDASSTPQLSHCGSPKATGAQS